MCCATHTITLTAVVNWTLNTPSIICKRNTPSQLELQTSLDLLPADRVEGVVAASLSQNMYSAYVPVQIALKHMSISFAESAGCAPIIEAKSSVEQCAGSRLGWVGGTMTMAEFNHMYEAFNAWCNFLLQLQISLHRLIGILDESWLSNHGEGAVPWERLGPPHLPCLLWDAVRPGGGEGSPSAGQEQNMYMWSSVFIPNRLWAKTCTIKMLRERQFPLVPWTTEWELARRCPYLTHIQKST